MPSPWGSWFLPLAYDAHLRDEFHAAPAPHRFLDAPDQALDVRRRGGAQVDDEIGVLAGHLRAAQRRAFQPACFDEPPGVITGRIAEHGAAAGFPSRVALGAAGEQRPDASLAAPLRIGPHPEG